METAPFLDPFCCLVSVVFLSFSKPLTLNPHSNIVLYYKTELLIGVKTSYDKYKFIYKVVIIEINTK